MEIVQWFELSKSAFVSVKGMLVGLTDVGPPGMSIVAYRSNKTRFMI